MTENQLPEPAPRDVIPNRMTRDGILAIDRMCCRPVRMTIPGELIQGPDGLPIGVGPNLESDEWLAPPRITRADAERLGLVQQDLQNVTIED